MTSAKPALLSVEGALEAIASAMPMMGVETVALKEGDGRVLASPIDATLSHPPASVSAMDGYAAMAADLTAFPADLEMIGESAAGHPYGGDISKGQCVRIFTGAHCPPGADTIILQEDTEAEGNRITVHEAPAKYRFIRPEGNDFSMGDRLFEAGRTLSARSLALIGSAGHGTVEVRRKPRVAVISTGDELVEPGVTPGPHQIISSNSIFLEKLIRAVGGEPLSLGIVRDEDKALDAALEQSMAADLIVTSGGASVGKHDGIARRMQSGSDLSFWRIAMRPGKPLVFGHIGGDARTPLLGLPGNPVSTGVCGIIFAAAAIRAMLGQDYAPAYHHAVLEADLPQNDRRQEFMRARMAFRDDGRIAVTALQGQDSGMMAVFAHAEALIMRPANAPAVGAGEIVPILMIPPGI
ncbi:MAG: molybdopterin molybdenumtransferase MoeA [SAR116 cluster bacterium MED-G04]|jgi:molybdopterin molybdotransferase|nr:MAG: molybdopterin molybdenumtransferase MoeA [SAR116 cluster bacterium MED-G04]CAI8363729.1 MAG: Molybdopterin molybdenumtransferase [SAR116 cluster bacterium MED-G04]HCD49620.1 molybdopterin molybdenumtransferase MoeA [Alphaproteobacteria bacterium]HCV61792.1 molybdopterin molybdenumtransferase MoeA [Alphaproteobacteria bacterium]|tara:strand:- start:2477 stop:3706 length:1230 start_codon:yes stop_codon:yes gene_type:complete